MVVIFFPGRAGDGRNAGSVASPLMCTVQAPQRAMHAAEFVPVMFKGVTQDPRERHVWADVDGLRFSVRVKVVAIGLLA